MVKKRVIAICAIVIAALLIAAAVFYFMARNIPWGFARDVSAEEAALRRDLVETAEQWLGANSIDSSHQQIIDLYNAHEPLAQNYAVRYDDKWCATFVSAAAIQKGITDILPTECSCERQIELFQQMARWEENDAYVPLPGDVIYYSSNAPRQGDCTTWSDHVGIVVGTYGKYIKVIEGNYYKKVTYHYITVDAATIRGYGLPDYYSLTQKMPME